MDDEAILQFEDASPRAGALLRKAARIIEEEAAGAAARSVVSHHLELSLKWGQPSFALVPKRGTPVRLGLLDERPAVFVHCATTLVEDWRLRMGPDADVSGRRAVFIPDDDAESIRPFIRSAFDYRAEPGPG